MKNGKFGISTTITAALAFALCVLRQPVALILVAGFALLGERDSWLNRQVIQALLLSIVYYIIMVPIDWIFGELSKFFVMPHLFEVQNIMVTVQSVLGNIVYIALVVFAIIAIYRTLRGEDADLPFISRFADPDFRPKPQIAAPQAPKENNLGSSQSTPTPRQSGAPIEPVQQETDSQGSTPAKGQTKYCSNCGNSIDKDSAFCSQCGTKI